MDRSGHTWTSVDIAPSQRGRGRMQYPSDKKVKVLQKPNESSEFFCQNMTLF